MVYKKILVASGLLTILNLECHKNFLLLSAPGSGKGTFSQYMVTHHKYIQISPGDLLRDEIKKETELGVSIRTIIAQGNYVDDSIVMSMIEQRLQQSILTNQPWIIEGFPRSKDTVAPFLNLLEKYHMLEDVYLIELYAPDSLCLERIEHRLICSSCNYVTSDDERTNTPSCTQCGNNLIKRKEDTRAIALKRIAYFHNNIRPLFDDMPETIKVFRIDTTTSEKERIANYERLLNLHIY